LALTVKLPVDVGVKLTWHVPAPNVHEVAPKEPTPLVLQSTLPAGTLAGVVVSVTVTAQVTATLTTPGLAEHETALAVVSPPLMVTVPLEVSRLNMPLHVAPPGMQSFTFELNEADASVSPSIPTIWFALAPRLDRGNDASRNAGLPFVQAAKLQLCCALPTCVRVEPTGFST
jgi:hypothetical protein